MALTTDPPDLADALELYSLARALAAAPTAEEVARALFRSARTELEAVTVGLWLVEGDHIRYRAGWSPDGPVPDRLISFPLEADIPATEVVRTGRPVTYESVAERERRWPALVGAPARAEATAVLPLTSSDRIVGCVHFGFAQAKAPEAMRLAHLHRWAELAGAALDRASLHDAEHELAHELQRLLLPASLPAVEGMEIAARYVTARSGAEAGGDFYDVVRLPSGRMGFVIGDVEGHDPEAAAVMGQLRAAIRALAGQVREPAAVLDALRWSWELLGFPRMATCLLGRLDQRAGRVVMASAGHLPPILLGREGAEVLPPSHNTPPLGAPGEPARQVEIGLDRGQTLFLYTDGLVETQSEDISESIAALAGSLAGRAGEPLDSLCEAVLADLDPDRERVDDVAVLAIRLV